MTHEDWVIINKNLEHIQQALAGLSQRVLALEKAREKAQEADKELSELLLEYWK